MNPLLDLQKQRDQFALAMRVRLGKDGFQLIARRLPGNLQLLGDDSGRGARSIPAYPGVVNPWMAHRSISLELDLGIASAPLASSEEMLCFITTLAIGHLPPFDMYCVLIIPALAHSRRPSLSCRITLPR